MRMLLAFAAALLLMDTAVIAVSMPTGHGSVQPTSSSDGPRSISEPTQGNHPWAQIAADTLGANTGAVYQQIREAVSGNDLIHQSHRVAGDDFEIVLSLATRASHLNQGFPSRVYCLDCERERCRFAADTLRALETMANSLPSAALSALSDKASAAGQSIYVTFVGGASGGRVFKWREEHMCDGFGFEESAVREPPSYDEYRESTCGVASCTVLDTGESVELHSMEIDSNAKLACLRGACLRKISPLADRTDISSKIAGDVALDDGGRNRGAEIVITLRGLASDVSSDYYQEFWAAFRPAARAQ